MKTQPKPIIALASGAVLLSALVCQTAHAQDALNTLYSVNLADVNHNTTGNTVLNVQYEITENANIYTYSYTVNDTAGLNPVNINDQADVIQFTVDFNAGYSGVGGTSVVPNSITQAGVNNATSGISWFSPENYLPTGASLTMLFQSDFAPTMGNASANGDYMPPSPWSSVNSADQVAIPNVPSVPEPATTSLLALTMFLLPFRACIFKKR